jgi:hypothetical protein
MNQKPQYAYFIADQVYHFYKLSSRSRKGPIILIHAGPAFNGHGEYTNRFKELKEKYQPLPGIHETSSSFEDFLNCLYLCSDGHWIAKNSIHFSNLVFEVLQRHYEYKKKEVREKVERAIEDLALDQETKKRIIRSMLTALW